MRLLLIICAALMTLRSTSAGQTIPKLVWQPVQHYFIHIKPGTKPMPVEGTRRLNSFTAYTHLGTDFGFMGPAEHDLEWKSDEICAHLGQEPDAWSGMWHSLAGLAREPLKAMDFTAVWPSLMAQTHQPRVSSLRVDVRGQGRLKLEIKSDTQETLWQEVVVIKHAEWRPVILPLSPVTLRHAKLLSWIAEPGSELCIDGLMLGVEMPDVPWDEQVLAISYAKLARCYDAKSGFVKDRAHLEDGAFESLASTGLFALATAAVSTPPLAMVSQSEARQILRKIHSAVQQLDRPMGVLPHFVRRTASGYRIHPGTEYSTVDTAIYYHSMLLGAEMTGDEGLGQEAASALDQIDFERLRLPGGEITHGIKEDGCTLLEHGWKDWGGETALVMMLQNIVNENAPRRGMERPGQAWQGTGFIPEIQSLFYPDFDRDEPDALDGVRWRTARRSMLSSQRDYIQRMWPSSMAARLGMYGLSAGEGLHGDSYHVGGVSLPNQAVLHPHYILMSAPMADPAELYALLARMERAGFFPPWGMVETTSVTGASYLPMIGSLNAGFEALGAYHLLAKKRVIPNMIYAASQRSPMIRRAAALFYPASSSKGNSKP